MSFVRWVVDACVLYQAAKSNLDAVGFLCAIRERHGIALDQEGVIEDQYSCLIRETSLQNSFVKEWFIDLNDRPCGIYRYASRVPSSNKQHLCHSLGMRDDDLVYVGVACQTVDKTIVTEDLGPGDFGPSACQYLEEKLNIAVMPIVEAYKKAQLP